MTTMTQKRSRQAFEADLTKRESPFVVYGTPLPPLDDDARDDGSYVPVWKQEVTDDRGRKRLHGAFTGGFSAGYFNTVGSKEGWTPATFVSSRTNRMKDQKDANVQKAEDYMDEEDKREAEESRHLTTTDGFAGFGTADDPMRKDAFIDLLRPAEDSMGVSLLKKMGWKPGQGIGPRIKRAPEGEEESSQKYLFAPDDVPVISFVKKNDFRGLNLGNESTSTNHPSRTPSDTVRKQPRDTSGDEDNSGDHPGLSFARDKRKAKKASRGGFGVGILNDTGSDEEDPYSMGPKISYNRTLGGDKKNKTRKAASAVQANPLVKTKPVFVPKKLSSLSNALRKCHDGRLPLAGFVLADELDNFSALSLDEEKYKPPKVPDGWTPSRAPNASAPEEVSSSKQQTTYQSTAEAAKASNHTSQSRAALLGENALPGKSVFDFLTPAARDRLAKASGKTNLPAAMSEKLSGTSVIPSDPNQVLKDKIPLLDADTAIQALERASNGGFMPYSEDPSKRSRYKYFLEYSAGLGGGALPARPPALNGALSSVEDYVNELTEFVRAAEVFRPVAGGLGSRFTSSSSSATQQVGNNGTDAELVRKPSQKVEDPAEVAAKLGMFGIVTRSIVGFYPTKLVCKRFGVEMPMATSMSRDDTVNDSSNNPVSVPYQSIRQTRDSRADDSHSAGQQPATESEKASAHPIDVHMSTSAVEEDMTHNAAAAEMIDPDRNAALEEERPGAAVFRAIFGSDSEDDD